MLTQYYFVSEFSRNEDQNVCFVLIKLFKFLTFICLILYPFIFCLLSDN